MSTESRRSFVTKLAAGSLVAAGHPVIHDGARHQELRRATSRVKRSPNDLIQFALIGAGGMGKIDANTAISTKRAKLMAACDLYDGRLTNAQARLLRTSMTMEAQPRLIRMPNQETIHSASLRSQPLRHSVRTLA